MPKQKIPTPAGMQPGIGSAEIQSHCADSGVTEAGLHPFLAQAHSVFGMDPLGNSSQYGMLNLQFANANEQLMKTQGLVNQRFPGAPRQSNSASMSGCNVNEDYRAAKSRRTSMTEATSRIEMDASAIDPVQQSKTLALQAKNRRAQQRFRERQKARVSELLDQVAELSEKLQKLEDEKIDIANHKNIVEKMVKMKDEHAMAMAERLKVLEARAEEGHGPGTMEETVKVTDSQGELVVLSRGSDMLEKLHETWRGYVNTLAGCLVEGGSENPSEELLNRISRLVADAYDMSKRAALYHPTATREWLLSSMEDTSSHGDENDKAIQAQMRIISSSLNLTADQHIEIGQLRKMHLANMEALCGTIARSVKSATSARIQEAAWKGLPSDNSLSGRILARQFISDSGTITAMKDGIREQIKLETEFESTLFLSILTPIQVARIIVQSYPAVPDALGFCNSVLETAENE